MARIPDYEALTVFLDGEEDSNNCVRIKDSQTHYQYGSFDSVLGAIIITIGVGFILLLAR